MKKLITILITLLVTTNTKAQSFSKIIQTTKSEYINDEWKTIAKYYPSDQFVIIKDEEIRIGTYKFRTYDNPEKNTYETHICWTWKCINENGQKCLFLMKVFKPEITSHKICAILYSESQIMYEYEIE